MFLLCDKRLLSEITKMFDDAIEKDPTPNEEIKKIIRNGQNEEKKDDTIIKNRVLGFGDFYKNFSNSKQAYDILDILKVNVCPYCNRQYTFTVRDEENEKIRPQFDHFYPQAKYPYLGISIYNLVPSCGLCNQRKLDTSPENFLYPYEESFEDKGIYFEVSNVVGNLLNQEQIKVSLQPKENQKEVIKQYNDSYKIELLYNEHAPYISELLYKNFVFNDDAIKSIYNSYKELFDSPSELKRLIFGNYDPENYNQRPLSKLTNDIMQQLKGK